MTVIDLQSSFNAGVNASAAVYGFCASMFVLYLIVVILYVLIKSAVEVITKFWR